MKGAREMQGLTQEPETMENLSMQTLERLKELRLAHLNGSGETQEPQKIYDCQKCRDTGYYEIEKDGYTFMKECECGKMQRERIERKLRFAAIPKEFEGHTVDNFRTDCYSTPQAQELAKMAKLAAKRYVEKFPEIQELGKGFYFHSNVKGSGKTRLAVSIANDLIKKYLTVAKFCTTIQILDQIRETWGGQEKEQTGQASTETRLIHDIVSVPVLVIDDIGVERPKDWINERFYNILNGRMIEKRITIFTSNFRINELRLDDRIVDRINKMALPIEFPAESIRSVIARKENDDLLNRLLGI